MKAAVITPIVLRAQLLQSIHERLLRPGLVLTGEPCCSELSDEDVRTAIKNSAGVKGSLLIPDAPFELLVRSLSYATHASCS